MTKANAAKIAHHSRLFLKKNSNIILTIGSLVCLGVSLYCVAKAAPEVDKKLQKKKDEKGEDLTVVETIKEAVPDYIPAIIATAGTVTCICVNCKVNRAAQATLVGAISSLESSYRTYREHANKVFGDDADTKIQASMANFKGVYAVGMFGGKDDIQGEFIDKCDTLFFDSLSQRYFRSSIESLYVAEYHLNRMFKILGEANLNMFYEFLGLEPTEYGEIAGWTEYGSEVCYDCCWLDFEHELVEGDGDDMPSYYIISPCIPPSVDYQFY